MKLALAQFDILWEDAPGNVAKLKSMILSFNKGDFDVLILPELWTCGFTMNKEAHKTFVLGHDFMTWVHETYGAAVLGGLPAQTETGQQNRCYLVDDQGSKHYSKIKVFKFAGEHEKYEPGSDPQEWTLGDFTLAPFICYDLRFPELPRAQMPQTNLITYVANWPEARIHHWRSLLRARAIENLSYVVGVNRVGQDGAGLNYVGATMVIAPNGDIVFDAEDREGIFLVDIEKSQVDEARTRWPFLADM
jgi:predicted amidohydrolase